MFLRNLPILTKNQNRKNYLSRVRGKILKIVGINIITKILEIHLITYPAKSMKRLQNTGLESGIFTSKLLTKGPTGFSI